MSGMRNVGVILFFLCLAGVAGASELGTPAAGSMKKSLIDVLLGAKNFRAVGPEGELVWVNSYKLAKLEQRLKLEGREENEPEGPLHLPLLVPGTALFYGAKVESAAPLREGLLDELRLETASSQKR